ncbi:MAG: malto-oligosyltrehalose synthase [Gammaproteobacteria bacterium]
MRPPPPPTATYRLQFNRDFTFDDAADIIPYLHQLGISHIYASPYLRARAGSSHGYDIVDHNALNPEVGDENSLNRLVATLHAHGMGQILDIVPNHMGVGGDDNHWWLDVLENGESSVYAAYFDIDWHPVNPVLHNKILLPFLGDHYGKILEQGELQLRFDAESGAFSIYYHEHRFPVDPRTYPKILGFELDTLSNVHGASMQCRSDIDSLIADCNSLPRRTDLAPEQRQLRRQHATTCKHRLAELYSRYPGLRNFIHAALSKINGTPGNSVSFDNLHHLLEAQAYRLSHWQVATDEINYRRFFDVNELAGIRMDNNEVFHTTHHMIQRFINNGDIDGVRIDHPDGLSDPFRYYTDLCSLTSISEQNKLSPRRLYIAVEKILASYEKLPNDWPVTGTTGYEVAHLINRVFSYPKSERKLTRLYTRFIRQHLDFEELLYNCKKLVITSILSSELTVLANLISSIAQDNRRTRDFTYQGLRAALGEVVACFPVYRTYISPDRCSDDDRRYLQWAIAQAKKRHHAGQILIFDFIHELLGLSQLDSYPSRTRHKLLQLTQRFQQYTAPVMAKGLEDTALYIYNRLVSLNDVGFNPRTFGISINAFHLENRQRKANWPLNMVTTSTHDSKRSGDVRARINVISEMSEEWQRHLSRWSRINRSKKRQLDSDSAPSRNDEYLLYQTLLGTWPLELSTERSLESYTRRISDYMLKATREAKVHTSWINPNDDYELGVREFIEKLLSRPEHNAFLADFIPFQRRVCRFGLLNALSQTLLKLTIPGIPDLYQGNELWAFNLVDPDNRRKVDYPHYHATLNALIDACQNVDNLSTVLREQLEHLEDGWLKLYLVWKTLAFRREYPRLFAEGEYIPLDCTGDKAEHICAFSRRLEALEVLVVTSRWYARLMQDPENAPLGSAVWGDSKVQLGEPLSPRRYRNLLTNETVQLRQEDGTSWLYAADLFSLLPFALLVTESDETTM